MSAERRAEVAAAGRGLPLLFGQMVETIGLGEVRLHDVRHAFAIRLLEANIHPRLVSEALGHASVGITLDVYSHVLPSMSRTAADAIDAVFEG